MHECPYCLNPILDTEKVTTCRICGTPYHTECIEENGGCALNDCETRSHCRPIEITVDAEPRTMLVLSRESVEEAPTVTAKRSSNPCLKCGIQLPLGEIYCPDCAPMSEDGFDSRSIGPLLVMVGAIALVVVWMAVWLLTPPKGNAASDLTVGPITTEVTR